MKKVFRIHNEGATNTDWFSSLEPGGSLVKTIKDGDGAANELPSSIPSPFARMDLVRSAFKYVNENGLDGNSYHHKLVSDALDIGQILFNFDTHKEHLQLIAWNKNSQLNQLKNSGIDSQVHLAETLELFIKQDEHFNFNKVEDLYILKYNHTVIGGTSPLTLFFAAPFNDKKSNEYKLNVNIRFGNDIVLDDEYLGFYKRDPKYIKYIYALSRKTEFAQFFGDFYEYINKSVRKLQQVENSLFSELNNLNIEDYFSSLEPLHVQDIAGNNVYPINGLQLYKHTTDPTSVKSDFEIASNKKVVVEGKEVKPLVLPVEAFNYRLKYLHDVWDAKHPAPYKDSDPIEKRRLPHINEPFPYLTLDDFLENSILRLNYELNEDSFYSPGDKYLLPLKKTFFEYFSAEELKSKKLLEVISHTNSIDVKLKIPIKGNDKINYITYKRIYKKPSTVSTIGGYSGLGENDGVIKDVELGLAITPPITGDIPNIEYRVGAVMSSENDVKLSFFNMHGELVESKFDNKRFDKGGLISKYYVVPQKFGLIEIDAGNSVKAFARPLLKNYGVGNTKFSFAIDFGTSNTHIEYKTDQIQASRPFEISSNDAQIAYSFVPKQSSNTTPFEDLLTQELFPLRLNDGSNEYGFPIRTAILQNKDVNVNEGTFTFNHYNIAFDFEKKQIKPHLDHKTNIKWSNYKDTANRKQLEHYIEHILILIKSKVLLNEGDIANTEIIWFYPSSMGESKVKALNRAWQEQTQKVFGAEVSQKLKTLPESIAPFYFYNNERVISAQTLPIVSIDIGGGTADVVIYKEDKPQLLTSFKYAGNAIFGDGYGGSLSTNGFIIKYLKSYKEKLGVNSPNLFKVLDQLENKGYSEDIINFFFNLVSNKELTTKNVKIDFGRELESDNQLKVIFLLYFSSIFYHITKIMLEAGYKQPPKILFSGTGAKTAFIADQSANCSDLSLLFNAIFKKLSNKENEVTTSIILEEKPKEITAKGGLYSGSTDLSELDDLMMVQIGGASGKYPSFKPFSTSNSSGKISYQTVLDQEQILDDVVEEVINFFKLFLELHSEINFHRKFGVSQYSIQLIDSLINESRHELMDDIKRGLQEKQKEVESTENTAVDETLFFYPLTGALNRIAKLSVEKED